MTEPSRLEAILGAVEASIRDPRAVSDRAGFLAAQALDPRDQAALAELEDNAFLVYRKIIRRSLASAIAVELPRTAALLGPRFDEEVAKIDGVYQAAVARWQSRQEARAHGS